MCRVSFLLAWVIGLFCEFNINESTIYIYIIQDFFKQEHPENKVMYYLVNEKVT